MYVISKDDEMTGCMSYYRDDKKLKKYTLFKNTVDNTMILVYYYN